MDKIKNSAISSFTSHHQVLLKSNIPLIIIYVGKYDLDTCRGVQKLAHLSTNKVLLNVLPLNKVALTFIRLARSSGRDEITHPKLHLGSNIKKRSVGKVQ
jgi:hypothetical protein